MKTYQSSHQSTSQLHQPMQIYQFILPTNHIKSQQSTSQTNQIHLPGQPTTQINQSTRNRSTNMTTQSKTAPCNKAAGLLFLPSDKDIGTGRNVLAYVINKAVPQTQQADDAQSTYTKAPFILTSIRRPVDGWEHLKTRDQVIRQICRVNRCMSKIYR